VTRSVKYQDETRIEARAARGAHRARPDFRGPSTSKAARDDAPEESVPEAVLGCAPCRTMPRVARSRARSYLC
jgi:hypothetical protein